MSRTVSVNVGEKIGKLTILHIHDGGGAGKYKMCDVVCECGKKYTKSTSGIKLFKGACCREVVSTCKQCGSEFKTKSNYNVYCSDECRVIRDRLTRKIKRQQRSQSKIEEKKAYRKKYNEMNRDKILRRKKEFYDRNKVRITMDSCYRKTVGSVKGVPLKDIVINSIAVAFQNRGTKRDINRIIKERVQYAESRNLFR